MNTEAKETMPLPTFNTPDEKEYDHPPPAYDGMTSGTTLDDSNKSSIDKKHKLKEVDVDVRSVNSTTTTLADFSDTLLPNIPFDPAQTFHIAARGIGMWRLPIPSSELEIDVYNSDGSTAYTSTRARRSKGDAILASASQGDLISTNYFFGPNKQPIIRDLRRYECLAAIENPQDDSGEFEMRSKWTSRSITLVHRLTNRVFEWSYDKSKSSDGSKANLLVLKVHDNNLEVDKHCSSNGKVIAQLVRSEKTRTPGTKSCTAGNGGQLVLDQTATDMLDEALIIATCLMMLKKEIDRRRAVQFMILSGAAGGGGG